MKQIRNVQERLESFDLIRRSFYLAVSGKWDRPEVMRYNFNLEDRFFKLIERLHDGSYSFGPYYAFYIYEPKKRLIHSATFEDRIVHQAIYALLNPFLDKKFYEHSYACREGKGHHRAMLYLKKMINGRKSYYFLKGDMRKYFESISRDILCNLLGKMICDEKFMILLRSLICSAPGVGLLTGNQTSQLFANVYLNELDQYIKRELRIVHYVRYMDDFVILGDDIATLKGWLKDITHFLKEKLSLELNSHKTLIGKTNNGISFVGYHLVGGETRLRSASLRRYRKRFKKMSGEEKRRSFASFAGHASYVTNFLGLIDSFFDINSD